MNRYLMLAALIFSFPLGAHMHFENESKEACAHKLEEMPLPDLWDRFLQVQTDLFFPQEAEFLAQEPCWRDAKEVLEIGSGNGSYLHNLACRFEDKHYLGIEKLPQSLEQAHKKFPHPNIRYQQGDAGVLDEAYVSQFDVVLFRLTLQHLTEPRLALEHAYHYLKPQGHIIIIDSYDPARIFSHDCPTFLSTVKLHNDKNQTDRVGNRLISMEILKELNHDRGPLVVAYTNLNEMGTHLTKQMKFEGDRDRLLVFNQTLLYLELVKKQWGISLDFSKAYDELSVFRDNPQAWACPGMHVLILKRAHS